MASYFRMTTVFLVLLLGLAMVVISSGSDPATGVDESDKGILQILLALRHPKSGPLDKRQNEGQDEAALREACFAHWRIPVGGECLELAAFLQRSRELFRKYNLLNLAATMPEELVNRAPWGFVKEFSGIGCATATNDSSAMFGLDLNCDDGRCVCGNIPPPCPRPLPDVNIAECEAKITGVTGGTMTTTGVEGLGNNQNSADGKLAGNRGWLLSFVVLAAAAIVILFKN